MDFHLPTEIQTVEINKTKITIGIISDTHIPTRANKLPKEVYDKFENVDLVVHAGDFVDISVVSELEKIAPLFGVQGNMDLDEIRESYPELVIIKIYDKSVGVYHGSLLPWKLQTIAKKYNLNVLISGHTHRPSIKEGNIIFINPGSPTVPFFAKKSLALLNVTKESVNFELIYI